MDEGRVASTTRLQGVASDNTVVAVPRPEVVPREDASAPHDWQARGVAATRILGGAATRDDPASPRPADDARGPSASSRRSAFAGHRRSSASAPPVRETFTERFEAGIDPESRVFRRYALCTAPLYLASVLLAPVVVAFYSPGDGHPIHGVQAALDVFCVVDFFVQVPRFEKTGGRGGAATDRRASRRRSNAQVHTFVRLADEPASDEDPGHLTWTQRWRKRKQQRAVELLGVLVPLASWGAQGPFSPACRGGVGVSARPFRLIFSAQRRRGCHADHPRPGRGAAAGG